MSASVPPPGYVPPPDSVAPPSGMPAPARAPAGAQSRRPRAYKRLIPAGVAVVAVALGVFVLFGSSSSVNPIAQAATVSSSAPGYRMKMSFVITSQQLGAPISGSASAVVDPPDHAASMTLAMDVPQGAQALGSTTLRLAMVLDGQNVYVKFPQALVSQLPSLGGKPWVEVNAAKATGLPGLSSLSENPLASDPAAVLAELRAGADSIVNEGPQVVDGVPTTHYHAEISFDHLLGNVPSASRALLQQLMHGQGVPVDVWIDAHNLVRRVVTSLSLSVPNGPSLQETATADLSDYGPQARPALPPAGQVTNASSLGAGLSS